MSPHIRGITHPSEHGKQVQNVKALNTSFLVGNQWAKGFPLVSAAESMEMDSYLARTRFIGLRAPFRSLASVLPVVGGGANKCSDEKEKKT